jgi:hypothetical protein
MKLILFAAFGILMPVFAIAANSPRTETIQIGSTRFCVPQEDVIRIAAGWIPNNSIQLERGG